MSTGITPTWSQLRYAINQAAQLDGEWAGAPMPVSGLPLVIEPRYPYAGLNGFCFDGTSPYIAPDPSESDPDDKVWNHWYSHSRGCSVYICGPEDKRFAVCLPEWGASRIEHWLHTIGASRAWDIDTEVQAIDTLSGLLSEARFRSYMLTGSFLETSPKSGVTYLFRKLRPTVALRVGSKGTKILAVLCLHPIGYYQGSWAGCMCPTDDVIAHLLLMRGDEHHFWRKSNHHPSWSSGAGI